MTFIAFHRNTRPLKFKTQLTIFIAFLLPLNIVVASTIVAVIVKKLTSDLKSRTTSLILCAFVLVCRQNCAETVIEVKKRLLVLHRHLSRFKWKFWWEYGKNVWLPVSVSQTKFVQFVQNSSTVKTRLVFPTTDWNAEILSGGSNDHGFFGMLPVRFLNNPARESRSSFSI